MFGYHVPGPNEALIVTGGRTKADGPSFKVHVGQGKFVMPVIRKWTMLPMDIREVQVQERCPTVQGILVDVTAIIAFHVDDNEQSIEAAAKRFGGDTGAQLDAQAKQIFTGHLRSIIGNMTFEDVIQKRQKLSEDVINASKVEVGRMGIAVKSFQIQEFGDCGSGYLDAIAAPQRAAVKQAALIAQAKADQAAVESQQESQRNQAVALRDTQLRQAEYQAEVDAATAKAKQAGPLQDAESQQAVIDKQAELAVRRAELREQELIAESIKPAEAARKVQVIQAEGRSQQVQIDAEAAANQTRITAEAAARQAELQGQGRAKAQLQEAEGIKATGEANAASELAIGTARANAAKAMADANAANDNVLMEQLRIEQLPKIAAALGESLKDSNLTVFNGADGVGQLLVGLVTQGIQAVSKLVDEHRDLEQLELGNGNR